MLRVLRSWALGGGVALAIAVALWYIAAALAPHERPDAHEGVPRAMNGPELKSAIHTMGGDPNDVADQ